MGGVGKSETVLQFVSKNEKALRQKFWAVLWVDNSSDISTRADFKRIGNLCGWPLDDTDALYGVKDRLASLTTSTLLILDNCDDTETDYSRYIPNGTQGQGRKLFHRLRGLDEESAVKLLLDASEVQEPGQDDHEQAKQIGFALEFHPLALTIASSLIRSRMYSLEEYANALGSRLTQKELLDTKSEQARYQKLSATFEVSAECLQRMASTDPSAKRALALLDVLGFMHHKGVAEEIFVQAWTYEEELLSKWIEDDGDDGDVLLSRYNNREWHDDDPNSISLHHTVHAWARERNSRPGETWIAAASILALSTQEDVDWSLFDARLAPHLETSFAVLQNLGSQISSQLDVCALCYVYALTMYWADSAHTVGVSEYILELSLKCKLPQANILRAQRLLGTAYGVDRRFPEAIEILERAERSHKEACPEYHEVGASIRHARGQAYHDQGQISKALDKLEYTVKAQTKLQNLDLLAIQHELGRAYLANGQTSAAIETLKHVVKSEEMLPESDPDRLSSQHALGSALYEKGQIPEAIEIGEHVVNVRRESLPEDDQTRLASEHSLAVYYREDGQTSRAVEMLEHVVKVRDMLPESHPWRLDSRHELARAFFKNGQISRAVEMLEHVVKVREMLPESHSDRLRSQHELAVAYLEDGQISKAVELLEHVVKLRSMLPESHLDRLKAQHSLAVAHLDNGQISKAVEMLEHVVKLREMLPELHPDQLNSQRELALAYQSNGQINAAMAVWYMVYTVLEAAVPTNHLDLTAAEDRMIRTAHIHASTDAESHHSEKMVCPGIASMLERARARIMSAESTSGHAGSMPSKDSLVEMALRKALMLEQARADSMSAEGTSGRATLGPSARAAGSPIFRNLARRY
ncbi:uncharacterized protein MYCGRDRAFT_95627 [Zymoseptoria tritici IPO323]|uniref:Uncharacterized protein n=1 Tax=Zymoseptoria tritici (strain CBS 115943 / IPO323) TaxID=336722 RepID=F9XJG2_ZYMTI|nr:uncharacterized protein MYCGRDRAFT_95627 [Zymoseptoria tritici IPO323]EGP84317.1 hypothetical protein MYCGRDRAFT_95627 [Zymoseptoria tritici IPO323]